MTESLRQMDDAARAHPRDRYIEIDGARLRYRDEGQGRVLLFVHGWTLDLEMWEPQAAAMSGEYRVIRLDRRGFGLSSGQPSLTRDVTDLDSLCRHLKLEQVTLVGMSQGARVVMQLACGSPHRVAALILDGSPRIDEAQGSDDPRELHHEYYRTLVRSHGLAAFRHEWEKHALVTLRSGNAEAHKLLARMIARYSGKDLIDQTPRPAFFTSAQMIASIRIPVLLIGGEFDLESRKRFAEELKLQLPQSERALIPGAGHLCNLDNPLAYNSAVRDFLARHVIDPQLH